MPSREQEDQRIKKQENNRRKEKVADDKSPLNGPGDARDAPHNKRAQKRQDIEARIPILRNIEIAHDDLAHLGRMRLGAGEQRLVLIDHQRMILRSLLLRRAE
ncbi:MAG: hypothetical protein G01um101433_1090, partial [Parcubacteria group bacterium Gr01-1014_33]